MFVKVNAGEVVEYPYSIKKLKAANPNTSFPVRPTRDQLQAFGVHTVLTMPRPSYDPLIETIALQDAPSVFGSEGLWAIDYVVQPKSTEDASASVRSERNLRLTTSDWTQVADAPVDQTAWQTYRQTLRDVTDQAGFPNTITWPQEPSA